MSEHSNARPAVSRILLWAAVATVVLVLVFVGDIRWQRNNVANSADLYSGVPFQPKVTYNSTVVTITNTEAEPYLDASLRVYIESTLYTLQVGTILPGETISRSLQELVDERGKRFNPGVPRTSQLEVRARFRGYDDHKDFPPPP